MGLEYFLIHPYSEWADPHSLRDLGRQIAALDDLSHDIPFNLVRKMNLSQNKPLALNLGKKASANLGTFKHFIPIDTGYNDFVDISELNRVRINQSETFVEEKSHINGIENFWNQPKWNMRR